MSAHIRHIDDADVQNAADEAVKAACTALDDLFPGYDAGGITSNFAGHLKEVILQMLSGRSVAVGRGTLVDLPRHVLTDASFGQPLLSGVEFLAVRRAGLNPVAGEFEALNDRGTGFVPLSDVENIDPFTSYEAGVQGVLAYLRGPRAEGSPDDYKVVPVGYGEAGYVLNPATASYPMPILTCLSPDSLN